MTRETPLLKLIQQASPKIPSNWEMTPKRKLAMERNWCMRILNCIEALCEGPLSRFGASRATRDSLLRAVRDVRFSIDHAYYQQLDKIDRSRK